GRLGPGDEVDLAADDAHHLARVVRRRPGDTVEVMDGAGAIWPAVVIATAPAARLRVEGDAPLAPPAAVPVTLYQGLVEWGRLDTVVEKAVELGAAEVVVFTSERARRVPSADAWERRRERLDRVAVAAARQSGRLPLPPVRLVPFGAIADEVRDGEAFLIDPRGDAPLQAATGAPAGPLALVVGPEAGFSDAEVDAARAGGLAVRHLGPAILRAETAAIAGLALVASAGWGEDA
ncbi:MAG: 16S rRNA (uracil(1498)-N(3))-methyltransferase, partial [Thermoleophilia bacterium]